MMISFDLENLILKFSVKFCEDGEWKIITLSEHKFESLSVQKCLACDYIIRSVFNS